MIGRLIGKIIAAPVRLANIPLKIAAKVLDETTCANSGRVKDYDPLAIDQVADAIEKAME